jgi:hypothetical protein
MVDGIHATPLVEYAATPSLLLVNAIKLPLTNVTDVHVCGDGRVLGTHTMPSADVAAEAVPPATATNTPLPKAKPQTPDEATGAGELTPHVFLGLLSEVMTKEEYSAACAEAGKLSVARPVPRGI